jgi:hypothetical protein
MRTYDRISSFFFTILALAICLESMRLGIGSFDNPGPGLVPLGCGLILGIVGLIVFACTFIGLPEAKEFLWGPETKIWKVVVSLVLLGCYAILIDFFGFILITFLWMSISCRWVGGMGWKGTMLTSVIATVTSYILFVIILKVNFPRGFIGF